MMKKYLFCLLSLVILLLTGCACDHQWREATCDTPGFCAVCSQTQGEALGHDWQEADCLQPRRCRRCGATQGQPISHNWMDPTCQSPKTCSGCGATEGPVGDHYWMDATTEAPKICLLCGTTEGEKLITDPRFTTKSTQKLQGIWVCDYTFRGKDLGVEAYIDQVPCTLFYRFGPTGELEAAVTVQDQETFLAALKKMALDFIYSTYPDKATADKEILAASGLPTEDYAQRSAERTAATLFNTLFSGGVYYAENGTCYLGKDWDSTFTASAFTLTEDTLILEAVTITPDGTPLTWKKVNT